MPDLNLYRQEIVTTSISDVPDRVGGDIWPSNPQQVILSLMAPPVQGGNSGLRLPFVNLDLVVSLLDRFYLGRQKPGRIGIPGGQHLKNSEPTSKSIKCGGLNNLSPCAVFTLYN